VVGKTTGIKYGKRNERKLQIKKFLSQKERQNPQTKDKLIRRRKKAKQAIRDRFELNKKVKTEKQIKNETNQGCNDINQIQGRNYNQKSNSK
jgi:hypothetical protein